MVDGTTAIQGIAASDMFTTLILAGGLMGAMGQGVRSVVGLKKMRDHSGDSGRQFSEQFSSSRFFSSLFIGFIAGALTAFFLSDASMKLKLDKEVLIGLMAAGYAGADTLEAFASKIMPGSTPA